MIQAIVYDAVGTLIHARPSVAGVYADVARRFGSRLDEATIRQRFGPAFAAQERIDAEAGWQTSEERERQRWRDIVAEVLDDVADHAGCYEALFTAFGQASAWSCEPDASELLSHLHQLGARQAMASNFDARLHGVIAPLPIAPYLERIIVSSEVGWRKPAPQFFAMLAETLQLPPSAILFVGDVRGNDYEPACRAGMRGLLLDPKREHLDLGADRIERLRDVASFFRA